jgi:fatty-acyl-CoA synthase
VEESIAILMPHVQTAQIAVWDAEIAGRACVINPMLRLDHIVALLTAARAKIAVILSENGDIDIWRWYPRFGARCLTHILHADADSPTRAWAEQVSTATYTS